MAALAAGLVWWQTAPDRRLAYVTVTDAPAPGRYKVLLTGEDGRQRQLGECVVTRRYCRTGATIAIPVDNINAVRLDLPDGPGMVAKLP